MPESTIAIVADLALVHSLFVPVWYVHSCDDVGAASETAGRSSCGRIAASSVTMRPLYFASFSRSFARI